MKFWIKPLKFGGFIHKDIIEIIPQGNKFRIGIMWNAWYYISKTWNVTWNIDRKYWFSAWNWKDY